MARDTPMFTELAYEDRETRVLVSVEKIGASLQAGS
jgi:hypothetical protein